jgi:hypothetical protein
MKLAIEEIKMKMKLVFLFMAFTASCFILSDANVGHIKSELADGGVERKVPKSKKRPKIKVPPQPLTDIVTKSYGEELPAFAYDYSEYFISAQRLFSVKEREFYITMMLLGHQSIYEDYPFEAMSTDHQTLNSWAQTTKIWRNDIEKKESSHRWAKKKLACVLRSADPSFSFAPVHWLKVDPSMTSFSSNDTNLNRNFEMIRCRFRLPSHQNMDSLVEMTKYLDIIEFDHSKKNKTIFSTSFPNSGEGIHHVGFPQSVPPQQLFSLIAPNFPIPLPGAFLVPRLNIVFKSSFFRSFRSCL